MLLRDMVLEVRVGEIGKPIPRFVPLIRHAVLEISGCGKAKKFYASAIPVLDEGPCDPGYILASIVGRCLGQENNPRECFDCIDCHY